MPRPRHPAVVILFAGYAISILLWLYDQIGGLYLPPMTTSGLLGFLGIPAFGALILLWALLSERSWKRWRIVVPALLLGALAFSDASRPLRRMSTARYLQRQDLNAFAAQVHAYGRISEMWEWEEFTHSLNGTVVRRTRAEFDSIPSHLAHGKPALLADVLSRDSIAAPVYEDFRRKLRRFHLQSIMLRGDYVLFRRGRGSGLLYATPHAPPLERGKKLPGTDVVIGNRVGQWYFFHW
jgi:hypothetical protein